MKQTLKLSLYLLLRVLMICLLSFMSVPVVEMSGFSWLNGVFAVFYVIVLLYFVIFTCWSIGGKDKIRVDAGRQPANNLRGLAATGLIFGMMEVVFLLAVYLPDSLLRQVMNVVNMVLSFCGYYLLYIFLFGSTYPGTYGVWVYTVLMLVCVISGGVGYYMGAKNIQFIQPWLNKWKR